MKASEEMTEEDFERIEDNLDTGTIMAILDKKKELEEQMKSLGKNELKKLIKNMCVFPSMETDGTETPRYINALETLFAIKDLQIEKGTRDYISNIAKAQKELDSKQTEDKNE